MDFVLYEGRDKVSLDVAALMQQILERYQAGILVTNVTTQGVQPPEQVQAAFDDAVKAGQDKERQKNEGQAYANEVIPKAKGEAQGSWAGGRYVPSLASGYQNYPGLLPSYYSACTPIGP